MIGTLTFLWYAAFGLWLVAAPALAASPAPTSTTAPASPGVVVAVGGGEVPTSVYKRMLKLAGGTRARVLVFPQASKGADGSIDTEEWKAAGAVNVQVALKLKARRARVAKAIAQADILWFGGGAQLRLLKDLKAARLVPLILERHRAGAIVGGTSAGAAVLSTVMLSGRLKRPLRSKTQTTYDGLGLWPEVIIDQHFGARKRFGRLITAVLDRPDLVGVGIGEDAAVVWNPGHKAFEVLGTGPVVIVDARTAQVPKTRKRRVQTAQGVRLHTLARGQRWAYLPK